MLFKVTLVISPVLQVENLKKFNGIKFVTYQIGIGLDLSLLKEWASRPANGKLFYKATYITFFLNSSELIKKLGKEFFISMFRSSHQRCSIEIGVFKHFTKFTGKHLKPATFLQNTSGQLFL